MNELDPVTILGILTLIPFVYAILREYKKWRESEARAEKCSEVVQLIEEVLDYQSHLDHARELGAAQEDALQKIRAICDPIGVQVEVKSKSNTIHLTSSIDDIKYLSSLKEHLPVIEELCQIYTENDPGKYLMQMYIKYDKLYDNLMNVCTTERWNAFGEDKKSIVQYLSDEYDRKLINKDDQENLIAQ